MTSAEILLSKDIRPSLTRVMIFDYLRKHPTHPTVDEIYMALLPEAPTLSKTTIYNTVKLLCGKGVVKMITIEEKQTRFDACTDMHGHFLCNDCGKVYDFSAKSVDDEIPDGFEIFDRELYYTGKCINCKK